MGWERGSRVLPARLAGGPIDADWLGFVFVALGLGLFEGGWRLVRAPDGVGPEPGRLEGPALIGLGAGVVILGLVAALGS